MTIIYFICSLLIHIDNVFEVLVKGLSEVTLTTEKHKTQTQKKDHPLPREQYPAYEVGKKTYTTFNQH